MDLTQFLVKQAQVLQKQLQNILEKSESQMSLPQRPFEATTDLQGLADIGVGAPADLRLRTQILFSRLNPYYEAGVLFEKLGDGWSPQWAFQKGFCFGLSPQEKAIVFDFPSLTLVEVKKASSQAVIHDLGLEEYLANEKITALVFRPSPDHLFLVLSELADPWLKVQIEKTQEEILKQLVDYLP